VGQELHVDAAAALDQASKEKVQGCMMMASCVECKIHPADRTAARRRTAAPLEQLNDGTPLDRLCGRICILLDESQPCEVSDEKQTSLLD
jgi:hypothetical protein